MFFFNSPVGELVITEACCDELMTVAVAPHQVTWQFCKGDLFWADGF